MLLRFKGHASGGGAAGHPAAVAARRAASVRGAPAFTSLAAARAISGAPARAFDAAVAAASVAAAPERTTVAPAQKGASSGGGTGGGDSYVYGALTPHESDVGALTGVRDDAAARHAAATRVVCGFVERYQAPTYK